MDDIILSVPVKLVNDPRNSVSDSLVGFVLLHSNVKLLEGCNAVVRNDLHHFKAEGKVAILSGGGSGHEPFVAGYVGKGFLTGSVAGEVFAAPSTTNVLYALNQCYTDAGLLMIVTNYTGDRLTFGKVLERAKGCGKKVEMVVVGEDCALSSTNKSAGRRGLCGTVFVYKIAGAMAEANCTLGSIAAFLRDAVKEMGTINVSLSSCSIPGKPPSFTIPKNKMEFGLGIHGEAGVTQIDVDSAALIVERMVDHIQQSGYMPPLVGKDVAVIINNLGGTSNLELSIMAKEVLLYLHKIKVSVKRCYTGTFVSSIDMAGVSLTLFILSDERLGYLDAPSESAVWKQSGKINSVTDYVVGCDEFCAYPDVYDVKAVAWGVFLFKCINEVCGVLIENEEYLNSLDRAGGDGDTGTTFANCAKKLLPKVSDAEHVNLPVNSPSQLLLVLAKEVEDHMGGSSGALISLFLTSAANGVKEDNKASFISSLELGIQAVERYGGAEEGDRTMLDALHPALRALKACPSIDASVYLDASVVGAEKGTYSTIGMTAKAGRASYVSNLHLAHVDPGAAAILLILKSIRDSYISSSLL